MTACYSGLALNIYDMPTARLTLKVRLMRAEVFETVLEWMGV